MTLYCASCNVSPDGGVSIPGNWTDEDDFVVCVLSYPSSLSVMRGGDIKNKKQKKIKIAPIQKIASSVTFVKIM